MDYLLLVTALLAVILMAQVDRIRFGTYLTPTALLGVPYMGVALLAFVIGPPQGFVSLYTPSVAIWVAYLALFWVTGHVTTAFLPAAVVRSSPPLDEAAARPTALIIAWLAIPVLAYGTWQASSAVGLDAFHEEEYRRMVGWGPMGHVLLLSIPVFIYLVGAVRRGNVVVCGGTSALLLILLALRPTKSWVLLPLVAGLLCRIRMADFRFSVKSIVVSILAMYALFNLSYLIVFGSTDSSNLSDSQVYEYLFLHAEDYLFAGVLGFGVEMQEGYAHLPDHAAVYSSIMNLGSAIMGNQFVGGIEDNFTIIRPGVDGFRSNVHTLFGTLIMCIGFEEAAIYTIVLSILTYSLFLASRRSRDMWVSVLWSFIAACLVFGWFSIYFAQFSVFEVSSYCLLIFAASRFLGVRSVDGMPSGALVEAQKLKVI